ncbi:MULTISPECIES: FecR family protein [Butyricimonas]|uniref:FecR family protein n=1 Tax=Butyricimonas TaxID=574697 RepID=UPI00036B7BEE|nr:MULTISPECIES: FecR domain-containing protein [Butyricimonas]
MEHNREILFEISALIYKSLSGDITREEQLMLDAWKNASERNLELYEKICSDKVMQDKIKLYSGSNVQTAFDSFIRRREKKNTRRRLVVRISRYAAIIALPLFVVLFYFNRAEIGDGLLELSENTVPVKRNAPVLTLSNGQEMILYNQDITLNEENGVRITMKTTGGMQYNTSDSTKSEMVYNTLTTPSQCDFTFTLADGTRVWLNAKSSLRYPVAFTGNERVVYAEGEIYLEVAKDRKHPFFVVLNGMKVEVLGTSFNINSYADENFAEVTLVEGHVAAHVDDDSYDLLPNRQLRWDKENQSVDIKMVNVNDYIAWKEGHYIFKGRMLSEVAKVLQRWYDVEVVFEDEESAKVIYTGVVYKEENFDVFIQRLRETSSLSCRMEGDKLYVK